MIGDVAAGSLVDLSYPLLRYFAPYVEQATSVPDPVPLPRPADNQPFRAGP